MTEVVSDSPEENLRIYRWGRRSSTVHRAQLSVLYHHKRERFFDSIDRFITAVTLVTASAASAAIYSGTEKSALELTLSLIAAVSSCLQVAYTPGAKAAVHRQLAADMKRLAARCEEAGQAWTDADCNRFTAELLTIEAGEAAPLGALVVHCANQVALAEGRYHDMRELGFRTLFMNWYDFDITSLKPLSPERLAALQVSSGLQSK